jgi:ribosomal protein L29
MLTDSLAVKPTADLVNDLRADGYDEAADEIERLRAELAELRAANGF